MALVALGVGGLQLLGGTNDTAVYDAAYLPYAAGYRLWLGRRTR